MAFTEYFIGVSRGILEHAFSETSRILSHTEYILWAGKTTREFGTRCFLKHRMIATDKRELEVLPIQCALRIASRPGLFRSIRIIEVEKMARRRLDETRLANL